MICIYVNELYSVCELFSISIIRYDTTDIFYNSFLATDITWICNYVSKQKEIMEHMDRNVLIVWNFITDWRINMNRTKLFYDETTKYRAGLRELNANYDRELSKIERYMGSEGYDEEREEIEKKRKEAITAFQREHFNSFMNITDEMRKSAKSRTMTAPTAEELALLEALKMREHIGRDELEQAARTLHNCPVGLAILDEIAAKNDVHGVHFGAESTESILNHIKSLEESAKRICALDKCDSRQEMLAQRSIYSPNHKENAMYSFMVDRDFMSEADALGYLGGVNDLASFREAVNE